MSYGARILRRLVAGFGLTVVLLGGLILLSIALVRDARAACWYGRGPRPPIVVLERYLLKDGDTVRFPIGDYKQLTAGAGYLGVRLDVARACYCDDLLGNVVAQEVADGGFVPGPLQGMQLLPVDGDVSRLQGRWAALPLRKRYRLELQLVCRSEPDHVLLAETIGTFTEEE